MTPWEDLRRELDAWSAAGREATLWWRDDDAVEPSAPLDRLLAAAGGGVPISLAVIPATASPGLAERIGGTLGVEVLQHGSAHANHAPAGEKKAELGPHRPIGQVLQELTRMRDRMVALFNDRFRPVLVPPWNRIGAELAAALPDIGLAGLSTYTARRSAHPAPGLRQVNCHVDIFDWRGRRFAGEQGCVELMVGHLAARRSGRADAAEPTGLLTHHLVHDDDCWTFLDRLIAATRNHAAVRWIAPWAAPEAPA